VDYNAKKFSCLMGCGGLVVILAAAALWFAWNAFINSGGTTLLNARP